MADVGGDIPLDLSYHIQRVYERRKKENWWSEASFWSLCDKRRDCWIWLGPVRKINKLSRLLTWFGPAKGRHSAQFWAYLFARGKPDTYYIINTCGNTMCVRPDHLQLSGPGYANTIYCRNGHLRTEENTGYRTYGSRICLDCLGLNRLSTRTGILYVSIASITTCSMS